jgi:hypothetical protein
VIPRSGKLEMVADSDWTLYPWKGRRADPEAGRRRWLYAEAVAIAIDISRIDQKMEKETLLPRWTMCMFRE